MVPLKREREVSDRDPSGRKEGNSISFIPFAAMAFFSIHRICLSDVGAMVFTQLLLEQHDVLSGLPLPVKFGGNNKGALTDPFSKYRSFNIFRDSNILKTPTNAKRAETTFSSDGNDDRQRL